MTDNIITLTSSADKVTFNFVTGLLTYSRLGKAHMPTFVKPITNLLPTVRVEYENGDREQLEFWVNEPSGPGHFVLFHCTPEEYSYDQLVNVATVLVNKLNSLANPSTTLL